MMGHPMVEWGKGADLGCPQGPTLLGNLSAVFSCLWGGAGSGRSLVSRLDDLPPSRLRVWLAFGTHSRWRVELAVRVFSRMLMGGMLRRWCRGSRGAVRNEPNMIFTTLFWTSCN